MTASDKVRVSRRTTLAWLSGAMAMSATGLSMSLATEASAAPTLSAASGPAGYGNDPDLTNSHGPWPRILTPSQLKQVNALADIFLPKVGSYPAPSEVGVADYVDEWVSAPYPDQKRDRGMILPGLAWMDSEANRLWQLDFNALDVARKTQLLEQTSRRPTALDGMRLYLFFRRLRSVVVGAYYSLPQNYAEIGYIGNIALEAFPPATAEENAFIDRAIAKLNL